MQKKSPRPKKLVLKVETLRLLEGDQLAATKGSAPLTALTKGGAPPWGALDPFYDTLINGSQL